MKNETYKVIARVIALAGGLVALVWALWAFGNIILGIDVCYVEPHTWLAWAELAFVGYSAIMILIILMQEIKLIE